MPNYRRFPSSQLAWAHHTPRHMVKFLLPMVACLIATGCTMPAQQLPDRDVRMTRGYTYYLDGAGGGKPLRNWSGGVRDGLLEAGYDGAGEMFSWETGLGVTADQLISVDYKRSKARELAQKVQEYARDYPGRPINMIGLSAGTAVAVFALEALPESCQIDTVILLGASISSNYNMTKALKRVRNRIYVFTSNRDTVLTFLVPVSGSADRADAGENLAGLQGFKMPPRPTAETRRLYAKITRVPWTQAFERAGNYGGHTDAVKADFVREHVAPLLKTRKPAASPGAKAAG